MLPIWGENKIKRKTSQMNVAHYAKKNQNEEKNHHKWMLPIMWKKRGNLRKKTITNEDIYLLFLWVFTLVGSAG